MCNRFALLEGEDDPALEEEAASIANQMSFKVTPGVHIRTVFTSAHQYFVMFVTPSHSNICMDLKLNL